jgi:hypothetical protein
MQATKHPRVNAAREWMIYYVQLVEYKFGYRTGERGKEGALMQARRRSRSWFQMYSCGRRLPGTELCSIRRGVGAGSFHCQTANECPSFRPRLVGYILGCGLRGESTRHLSAVWCLRLPEAGRELALVVRSHGLGWWARVEGVEGYSRDVAPPLPQPFLDVETGCRPGVRDQLPPKGHR